MKSHLTGFAVAALLMLGPILPCHAEEPPAAPASPAATPTEPPPPSVPRPSIVPKSAEPKSAEPTSPSAATEPTPLPRPRVAHRRYRHWGIYHTAYWGPFPIYWPHFHHYRIHWARIPWVLHF